MQHYFTKRIARGGVAVDWPGHEKKFFQEERMKICRKLLEKEGVERAATLPLNSSRYLTGKAIASQQRWRQMADTDARMPVFTVSGKAGRPG